MNKEDIYSIFEDAIEGNKIFKDKSVLFHDYIPESLPYRENEINKVAHLLSNLLKGYRSSNLFIYGKPGTGKTAVTRYVVKRFLEIAKKHGKIINFSYTNCRLAGTEYRVVYNIGTDIGVNLPFTGLSTEEAFNRVLNKIDRDGYPFLLILDEIDSLVIRHGDKLLYMLTRFTYDRGNIPYMIIGISNNLLFKDYMDPRVLSSLSEDELIFKPYKQHELEGILRERVKLAFYPGKIDDEAIKMAAAYSALEHGDARKALDLIRVAGEIAELEGLDKVTPEEVKKAYSNIDRERIIDVISSLPLHSRIIIISILNLIDSGYNSIKASILYTKYNSLASEITGRPLSYRRFMSLLTELNVLGIINKSMENFGRRGGRVSIIKLSAPIKLIRESLSNDPILGNLI